MTSWIITALLALFITRIVYIEIRGGRRSKDFLSRTNVEIDALRHSATAAYRQKFGRDPTAPFIRIDENAGKLSSKKS